MININEGNSILILPIVKIEKIIYKLKRKITSLIRLNENYLS